LVRVLIYKKRHSHGIKTSLSFHASIDNEGHRIDCQAEEDGQKIDKDTEMIISSDSEGNEYMDICLVDANVSYLMGSKRFLEQVTDDAGEPYTAKNLPLKNSGARKCVVIQPF